MPLRIAIVQFAPKLGHVRENVEKARLLCEKLRPHSVDLVCLPEMIFSGYVFRNAAHIRPHLEHPKTGPTATFCSELASRLHCYVASGFCERISDDEVTQGSDFEGKPVTLIGANSAVVYGPSGEWVHGYRKSNLYNTDMSWAIPGPGLTTFKLPPPLNTVTLGICMDLNPFPRSSWTLDGGPYELANHCVEHKSNILLLLNAWLDSKEEPETENDYSTINYWAARLRPLWKGSDRTRPTNDDEPSDHETTVIVCNRSGEENGILFAGTSAVLSMKQGSNRPRLLDMYGRRQEAVEVWYL